MTYIITAKMQYAKNKNKSIKKKRKNTNTQNA